MKQEPAFVHHHTLKEELLCHFPYAIFSVALSIIALSVLSHIVTSPNAFHVLFHDFHYLHILFSATGVVLTFRKYSKSIIGCVIAGSVVPAVFCTLSDSIMPYFGARYLDINVHFHWCFVSHLSVVLPFLVAGILNGFVLSAHPRTSQLFYSTGSHFLHILISSMASILFLVGSGASDWHQHLGFIFLFLVLAVLIPCTLSDIVVPFTFAKSRGEEFTENSSSHIH